MQALVKPTEGGEIDSEKNEQGHAVWPLSQQVLSQSVLSLCITAAFSGVAVGL